jgi:uncharacterized NAD(P)/FAD-binding protein YdhS
VRVGGASRSTVAIVGAGAAGSLLAVQLLRRAPAGTAVSLIERSGSFGPGVAYSSLNEAHRLNVCAGQMAAIPSEPDGFYEWLAERRPEVEPDAFAPRHAFGSYLTELLDRAEREAAGRVTLCRHAALAESVSARGPGRSRTVYLGSGERVEAGAVVLALGNSIPSCPAGIPDELVDSPLFVADPWKPGAIEAATADETVLLLGSGLTMVDVALELGRAGGPVMHAVSRGGLMPHAHVEHPCPPDFGPVVSDPELPITEMLLGVLAAATDANGAGWRRTIDSLRPVTNDLWQGLEPAEREYFHRRLSRVWSIHRHRMAPQVGDAIERLLAAGRLHVRAGSVAEAEIEGTAVNVELLRRGARTPMRLRVNRVINCTGPVHDPRRIAQRLVRDLISRGEVRPNSLGLGFDTDPGGALLTVDGTPAGGLYTLGPPRSGNLLETTAVPEIGKQADELAGTILRRLSARPSLPGPRSASTPPGAAFPPPAG